MTHPEPVALHVSRRVFALEGETRINLLRILGVTLFYGIHLVNRVAVGMEVGDTVAIPLPDSTLQVPIFDTVATALTIAWASLGAGVLLAVRSNSLQRSIGPSTTVMDIALLTILLLVGNGPSSPMIAALFLIVAASGLRGQRGLVWLATLGALGSYALCVGYAIARRPDLMPPTYHLLTVTAALGVAGMIADLTVGAFWTTVRNHGRLLAHVTATGGASMTVPPRTDRCPWCGDYTRSSATICGRCEQPLIAGEAFRGQPDDAPRAGRPMAYVAWASTALVLAGLSAALGFGLWVQFPALLVPYLGGMLILQLGMARLLQLDLRVNDDGEADRRTMTVIGAAAASVALGATAFSILAGLVLLLFVSALVIAFALCCAAILASA